MPGGCTYMRNVPPNLNQAFPEGVPEDIRKDFQPVFWDQVPLHWRPDGAKQPMIYDPVRKEMY